MRAAPRPRRPSRDAWRSQILRDPRHRPPVDALVPAGTPPASPADQRRDLIAFLGALTDDALLCDPRFDDPWRE